MADEQQLAILRQGVDAWNAWREQNRGVRVDLRRAPLSGADLTGANLAGLDVDLRGADFSSAILSKSKLDGARLVLADLAGAHLIGASLVMTNLIRANLCGAKLNLATLSGVDLIRSDLIGAQLSMASLLGANIKEANLTGANLFGANLRGADLTGATLTGANLFAANLVETNFTDAVLTGCSVYGISAWNLKLERATQKDLLITPPNEPQITVDSMEVAQFIYLLLNNERVRHVIDTITSKVVLILGRFTEDRKAVLDALREELRQRDYLPVLFDFDKPASRTTEETISTLAHMARFVIADLTDAKSVLQELRAVVPTNPSVPVQPLILATQEEPGMFDFFRMYPWMLEPYRYADSKGLLDALTDRVIAPPELMLSKT